MKIYINTNEEMIAENYEGDAGFGRTDFVEFVGMSTIAKRILEIAPALEVEIDSIFSNWNGGKHSQFAQCQGTLWCCHEDLPNNIESAIDNLIAAHIQEANRITESISS